MIKVIIFDLDDTLTSEKEYIKSGYREVAKKIAIDFNVDNESIYKVLWSEFNKDSKFVFNRTLDLLSISYNEQYIFDLLYVFRHHIPNIKLYSDVNKFINDIKEKGIKTGIITDGYKETQHAKIKALKLNEIIDYIIVTDDLGKNFWKPHSKAYEMMKKHFNVNYNEMTYIGDNMEKDFISPIKLGMNWKRIIRPDSIYNASDMNKENVITSLEEINNDE